ncbi:fatty acyl CoA synthetase 2 [Leishmania donovani]|uniref:Fatty_acyl_CoA_synthetase_2_-_putative n=4 Tax=Leishmania donovani species complex TaxID=38574 RepID=A0A6L0WGQ5_LEIIN|nr:putative fatty acyl CoA synthetase 2 [Leishmania infantum JPCM5]XP_003857866.1 fatty acyl CoA synthetase 2, putative [Leishmania donovani]CAC9436717.1 fatty_acyl_CoA_synthetase_2_-_putative [Leishmania infantum]AYU75564.1 fatty acyl CoA synthetase 2, putative [Leishmania donovani]CAJ1985638.1 fatty acyl CoA synthetase 2 [Leishmania donovani]CAM65204.1 putative fatty acyl CoA synthetase 2 [Leishmania infantum JPCM5]CBZ31140.1 fatty acyl CoA synthetase 2, putative [Leishmania donovani]|eukprot:XP_001462666.1 putative fatty acyl CoA synthetase 2 [Leishmania infantum JPCM5]
MENLESLYAQVSLCVPNGVCVVVHAAKYYVCAIACTTESKAMVFARQHDIQCEWPPCQKWYAARRVITGRRRSEIVYDG